MAPGTAVFPREEGRGYYALPGCVPTNPPPPTWIHLPPSHLVINSSWDCLIPWWIPRPYDSVASWYPTDECMRLWETSDISHNTTLLQRGLPCDLPWPVECEQSGWCFSWTTALLGTSANVLFPPYQEQQIPDKTAISAWIPAWERQKGEIHNGPTEGRYHKQEIRHGCWCFVLLFCPLLDIEPRAMALKSIPWSIDWLIEL